MQWQLKLSLQGQKMSNLVPASEKSPRSLMAPAVNHSHVPVVRAPVDFSALNERRKSLVVQVCFKRREYRLTKTDVLANDIDEILVAVYLLKNQFQLATDKLFELTNRSDLRR